MALFTCQTCSVSLEDQEMLKHLSATRHKSVAYSATGEVLECEKCQDCNIHQLKLVRYGGSDIALLCQSCFAKEDADETPSTQYTLQNGSIFKTIENYFKVRDLACSICSGEKYLNVNQSNPTLVVCSKCLRLEPAKYQSMKFVSENDDNFLYVLLGIKEHVKTSSSSNKFSRKRTLGRGKARGRGGKKALAPRAPRSNATPSSNSETLRSFQSLKSSEVAKQRPQDEKDLKVKLQHSTNDNKILPRSSSSSSSRSSKHKPSDKGSAPSRQAKSSTRKPLSQHNTSHDKNSSSKVSGNGKQKGPKGAPVKPSSKRDLQSATESLQKLSTSSAPKSLSSADFPELSAEPKPQVETVNEPATVSASLDSPNQNLNKGLKKNEKKVAKTDTKKELKKDIKKTSSGDSRKVSEKDLKKSQKNDTKKTTSDKKTPVKKDVKSTKTPEVKATTQEISDLSEEHEEFEHVPKYLSNQPKLSYDSINEYFKEMCFHLYLEEKLGTDPITNFTTEWHRDNKQLFKLTIPFTQEIENLIPEKLRKLGRLPFTMNQSLFVARSNDKDNIWDCFIKDMNVIKTRGKKIELLLELYKWNDVESFPVGSQTLSILPCSATISRILFAMARIDNPKFIKMLLGKEPIKQLDFKNFIKLTNDQFNESQKSAIQHVLNNSITVLQGPPGTGKTSTIYEIILQLLRNLKTFPILVVAASNVAIDNIAEKLQKDTDLTVLRIVSSEKEKEYNDKHHLANICLHHQVFSKLPAHSKDVALDLRFNRAPVSQNQYKKLLTVQNSINEKLIAQAQVILTTTVVAGGYQLKSIKKLPVVIMDESTQSTEASTMIPLSMPGVDRFIFVGDDKQLSSFSDIPYLEQSMFERVLKNGTYTNPHMLNVQYRMHPDISEFPIKRFYNNQLKNGVTEEQRKIEGIQPLSFIDYKGTYKEQKVSNYRRGGGYTYTNKGEVELILRVLKQLTFTKGIEKKNISIITPYSAQRDLIATSIQKDTLINPNNEEIEEEVDEDSLTRKKPTTIKTIMNIMVSSIDAFQGREKDIIIFSCVRSNEENKIGFVKDARRLNVALTRARSGLVLIGNQECMAKGDPLWNELMQHLESKKFIVSEEEYFKL